MKIFGVRNDEVRKKHIKDGENIRHKARIVTYVDLTKKKPKVIYYKNYRGEKLRRLIIFIKKVSCT